MSITTVKKTIDQCIYVCDLCGKEYENKASVITFEYTYDDEGNHGRERTYSDCFHICFHGDCPQSLGGLIRKEKLKWLKAKK